VAGGAQCRDIQVCSYTARRATCYYYYFLPHVGIRENPGVVAKAKVTVAKPRVAGKRNHGFCPKTRTARS